VSPVLIRTAEEPSIIKSSAAVFHKSCHLHFGGVADSVSELRF